MSASPPSHTQASDSALRARLSLPVDELAKGDLLPDRGRLRAVQAVTPTVVEMALVIDFADSTDRHDRLTVPMGQSVTLYRVTGAGTP